MPSEGGPQGPKSHIHDAPCLASFSILKSSTQISPSSAAAPRCGACVEPKWQQPTPELERPVVIVAPVLRGYLGVRRVCALC